MKRKIGIAIMFGLICINILSGCWPSSNEKQTDYVINDDGTYTYKDLNYSYKIEVSGIEGEKQVTYVVLTNDKSISFDDVTYSLKKSEISIDEPQFIILGWY